MYKVSSEIYAETNFKPIQIGDGKVISKFKFKFPNDEQVSTDVDGDLVVKRCPTIAEIELEHLESTELRLVGLQVWRGALLLADYFFHRREDLADKQILELGAGVGLSSIAAAIYAKRVVCSDVDIGGILNLIRANCERNRHLLKNGVQVLEYDFTKQSKDYASELVSVIDDSEIIVAADVIYDDELTDAFIRVIDYIFERQKICDKKKTIYIALEKRFVFTLAELDAVPPMYEYFIKQTKNKPWHFESIPLDFPQYFFYERCKHLLLIRITSDLIKK